MKAKKMLALLLSGAMALTVGAMAACDKGGNGGGNKPEDNPPVVGDYTVDTHEYHLVGDGAGDLKKNGWKPANHDLMFVRDETADHNVFNVTIDMYDNDAFKILCEDDNYDGPNAYKVYSMEGFADGVVADEEGNPVFVEGEYGNIVLAAGQKGNYTFSLHTYPDGEKEAYVSYTKNHELAALLDMYVVSDMNDFGDMQKKYEASHMEKSGNIWKYVLEITADDVTRNEEGEIVEEGGEYAAVAVWNDVVNDDGEHEVTFDADRAPYTFINGNGFNLLKAGAYTLRYNAETDTLTISDDVLELYFTGAFNDNTASAQYKLTEDADGNWYGYLNLSAASQVNLYNKYSGSTYSVNDGAQLEAGEYFVKFTIVGEKVAHEALAYYIAGNFADVFWGIGATSPKLTLSGSEYTVTLHDITALEFKVVYGSVLSGVKDGCWYGVGDSGNDNVVILVEGDYTITFNPTTKAVVVTELATPVTVTFDLNYPDGVTGPAGQVAPASQTINKRQTATAPTEEPTLDNYTFIGWYLDKNHTYKFEFSTPVTEDMTLYAGWMLTSEIPTNPKITFNWNDGTGKTEVVETVEGLIGENMPAEPVRNGYYFLGWYTTATSNTLFDFGTRITVDTNVFAKWQVADTLEYWLVGTINGWNASDKTYLMTKDASAKANIYTISTALYEGTLFKIVGDPGWNPQYNCDNLDLTNCEGLTAASSDQNIRVTKSGNYVVTLQTAPVYKISTSYETIVVANDIYFQVNGVQGAKLNLDGSGNWTGTITVKAGDVVKLIDKNNAGVTYDVNITEAGDYFVKLTISSGTVVVEQFGYYLAGDFAGAVWGINADSPKMTWDAATSTYKIEITLNAGAQFKVVYGTVANGVKDWLNNATSNSLWSWSGDNLKINAAGTYTISINPTNRNITIAK